MTPPGVRWSEHEYAEKAGQNDAGPRHKPKLKLPAEEGRTVRSNHAPQSPQGEGVPPSRRYASTAPIEMAAAMIPPTTPDRTCTSRRTLGGGGVPAESRPMNAPSVPERMNAGPVSTISPFASGANKD